MIHVKTVSEANSRDHWSKKAGRTRMARATAKFNTLAASQATDGYRCHPSWLPRRFATVVVTLARIAPGGVPLDDDNLRGALKATRDGVADALGIDDRHPSVRWEYGQKRGRKGEYAVEITIAPVG